MAIPINLLSTYFTDTLTSYEIYIYCDLFDVMITINCHIYYLLNSHNIYTCVIYLDIANKCSNILNYLFLYFMSLLKRSSDIYLSKLHKHNCIQSQLVASECEVCHEKRKSLIISISVVITNFVLLIITTPKCISRVV